MPPASTTARTRTGSTSSRTCMPWSARSCGRWASRCGASPGNDDVFGGYQAILFQRLAGNAPPEWQTAGDPPVNGMYRAGSDFRKDGQAVGW